MAHRATTTLLLTRVQRLIRRDLERALHAEGITYAQFGALDLLALEPGLTGADLARRSHTSRQAMNQLIASLIADDYVCTASDPGNARRQLLYLTAAGHRVISRCHVEVERVESAVLNDLVPSDQALLLSLLQRVSRSRFGEGA